MTQAALILAGGDARRLGGIDKPLLELAGQSLLERIIDRLLPQAAPIALSANGDPARFAAFGLPVLPDGAFAGQGPLAGVLAGLDWAATQGADTLLTVPGDTPFIPPDLAAALAPPPACASSVGQVHHLVALWPVTARAALRRFLSEPGPRGVRDFTAGLAMRRVDFPAVAWDPFHNVNTQDDLTAARLLAGRREAQRKTQRKTRGQAMTRTVAIAGLGAIGLPLARALDAGVPGLSLAAVAVRDQAKAEAMLGGFHAPPPLVGLADLADCDIVVEAAPAALFERIALPAIEAGRIFVACSVGALLPRMHLVQRAQVTGARIVVPTGALLGLDAVRAAAEGPIDSVTLETRKPPAGLDGAPYLQEHGIQVLGITEPLCVFRGNAMDAAAGFPANVNVAAALALAGIGPMRTQVEIWADPGVTRNTHIIRVEAEAARFTMTIEGVPSDENPRTGKLTTLSVLACLRGLVNTLKVGS